MPILINIHDENRGPDMILFSGVRISRFNLKLQLGRQRPDLCRLLSSLGLQVWQGEVGHADHNLDNDDHDQDNHGSDDDNHDNDHDNDNNENYHDQNIHHTDDHDNDCGWPA